MAKLRHEIRDPVHQFIQVTSGERQVVDSPPVQRLRHIHQLALTYLVYPGATHRRFEHSLGVMHLAGRVFDTLTDPVNLTDEIREILPQVASTDELAYWRSVVRLAALCHDVGHLPFSHAAEHALLPQGVTHETLTAQVILERLDSVLGSITPPVKAEVVAKLAVGPAKWTGAPFTTWEALLTDIITGDAFGVDRMDYLLRDSLHAGVASGRFDQHRLMDTLRILTPPPTGMDDDSREPTIGVEHGGINAAEALLLARYQMFAQVYFHPVRVAYESISSIS